MKHRYLINIHMVDYIHRYIGTYVGTSSGTSLLGTLWDLEFSPHYRGVLNSEVT